MKVLIEKGIPLSCISLIDKRLREAGISASYYSCTINKAIDLNQLSLWVKRRFNGKIMILSLSKICSDTGDTAISYKGITDKLNGNIAVVGYNNSILMPYICLHELLHLAGISHCSDRDCIMGLQLVEGELKYSLIIRNTADSIKLCDRCNKLWKKWKEKLN